MHDGIPEVLRQEPRWLVWRYGANDAKVPCSIRTGAPCNANSSDSWSTFAEAASAATACNGLGFALGGEGGKVGVWAGVDLDDCVDPQTGAIAPTARNIIDALSSYTEVSPSGTGVKVFVRLGAPTLADQLLLLKNYARSGLEIYVRDRYFTVTGRHVPGTPATVEARQGELARLIATEFPSQRGADRLPSEPLPQHVPEGSRDHVLFREASRLRRLGWDAHEITAGLLEVNRQRCDPPLHASEVEAIAASASKYEPAADTYPLSDTGNAEFFAATVGEMVRYDHGRQVWFVFDTHHWVRDRTDAVDRLALEAIRARQAAALKIDDVNAKKKHFAWAAGSESRTKRESLATLATKIVTLAVTGDDWDQHPMLLGVRNGVLDLGSGTLRDGRPDDLITKAAPTFYDPRARCPRWTRFLREIFNDAPDLADYVQRVIGYALTGLTTEQVFWILYGLGANGKSTLLEILVRHVFGDAYAWTMPFPSAGWSNAMSEYQKASLVGQRFVQASEVTRRGELHEELVKSMTGGDTINARHPYGRPFSYVPIAKFFFRVNDKPVIRDQSHGMWRRVKLVPFTQTFAVDSTLADTLASEAAGILAWAVQGCLDWQRDGLRHPAVVDTATADYRTESDLLHVFLAEECIEDPGMEVRAGVFFEAYVRWAIARQLAETDRLNQKAFGLRMKERFQIHEDKRNKTVQYLGVRLRTTGGGAV